MQQLTIYFNEQCMVHAPENYHWESGIKNLCSVIDDFFKIRTDARIAFPFGQLQADCGGRPLNIRIKDAYPNRDMYRSLLIKIESSARSDVRLLHEVYWEGMAAHGLTLADAVQSWAVSLFLPNTPWEQVSITAQRYELDEANGSLNGPTPADIKHLSGNPHTQHWAAAIRDWGATVAPSCILDRINGHPIVMYQGPKEHNPPHVHLLDKQSGTSLAKYNIDVFERPKGQPTWDAEMKAWIARYRVQLLKSWARCQQGGLPFQIQK